MKKRYWLFEFYDFYPEGIFDDYTNSFDTLEDIKEYFKGKTFINDQNHILDTKDKIGYIAEFELEYDDNGYYQIVIDVKFNPEIGFNNKN